MCCKGAQLSMWGLYRRREAHPEAPLTGMHPATWIMWVSLLCFCSIQGNAAEMTFLRELRSLAKVKAETSWKKTFRNCQWMAGKELSATGQLTWWQGYELRNLCCVRTLGNSELNWKRFPSAWNTVVCWSTVFPALSLLSLKFLHANREPPE